MLRALVVDDHPLIQEIVPAVLAKAFGEVVVATESTLEAGLERAAKDNPDFALLDLGLPGCEGIDAVTRFKSRFPRVALVVVSAVSDRASIVAALDAGASGYIPKTSKPDVMIAALKVVAAGGTYVPPEALEEHAERLPRRRNGLELTQRQKDVLQLLLKGYNNERIAAALAIAPNTVKQHTHAIFTSLGVSTRAEAVVAATRHGIGLRQDRVKKSDAYTPPDPAKIDVGNPEALRFWARTLETKEDKIRQAVRKVGPMLEKVKQELGIGGV